MANSHLDGFRRCSFHRADGFWYSSGTRLLVGNCTCSNRHSIPDGSLHSSTVSGLRAHECKLVSRHEAGAGLGISSGRSRDWKCAFTVVVCLDDSTLWLAQVLLAGWSNYRFAGGDVGLVRKRSPIASSIQSDRRCSPSSQCEDGSEHFWQPCFVAKAPYQQECHASRARVYDRRVLRIYFLLLDLLLFWASPPDVPN